MFKYSNLNYNDFYASHHCYQENYAIECMLKSICEQGKNVIDLGAGTGLVASMIGDRNNVIQVEKDQAMKKQNPYKNFVNMDAKDFLKKYRFKISMDYVVSLFAVNYMKIGTISFASNISKSGCVFVIYNKPYKKGSDSYYKNKPLMFILKHSVKSVIIRIELLTIKLKGKNVVVKNLLDEPYYKVVAIL